MTLVTNAFADRVARLSTAKQRALRALLAKSHASAGAGRDDTHPLSPTQRRVWLLQQLDLSSPVCHVEKGLVVPEPANVPALASAIGEVVARHEALRTAFSMVDGEPAQRVCRPCPYTAPVVDLRGLPTRDAAACAERTATDLMSRPFDLGRPPLVRALIQRLPAATHVFFTMHHLVVDGWSMAIFAQELSHVDDACRRGRPSGLPVAAQYLDEQMYREHGAGSARVEEDVDYWARELEGMPELALPVDRPWPSRPTLNGSAMVIPCDAGLLASLRAFSRRERVTPFVTLLSAFLIVLYRLTGQQDLTICSPFAGRHRPESASAIGFFINLQLLRTTILGEARVRDVLAAVSSRVAAALAHPHAPYERVLERLRRDDARSLPAPARALFQMFSVAHSAPVRTGGFVDTQTMPVKGTAQFPISIDLTESADALAGRVEFSTDLFDASTIRTLLVRYDRILRAVIAAPDARVRDLPLLSGHEEDELRGVASALVPDTIPEQIAEQARSTPDAIALVSGDEHVSYRALLAASGTMAEVLAEHGAGRETVVAICAERSSELMVALLAVWAAGAAYLPVDPQSPAERERSICRNAGVGVVLAQPAWATRFEGVAPVLVLDPRGGVRAAGADDEPRRTGTRPRARRPLPSQLAYVIYTSGSTGTPKGAMNAHDAVANRLCWMQRQYELTAGDRVLQKTPYTFDVSVWEFFWPLISGACLVMAAPGGHRDAEYLTEIIDREQITTLHFVPAMLREFLGNLRGRRTPTVRQVFASGESLDSALVEAFFAGSGARLHNLYGPTEAAVDVTAWECRAGDVGGPPPIGSAIQNVSIRVVDRDLNLVPAKTRGELFIGGVAVGRGYLGRADLTAERFVPDPFAERAGARMYRTGDLGSRRLCGAVDYLGRIDGQVKLRGFRIELGEIESAVMSAGAAAAAAVTLADEGSVGARLVCFWVPAAGRPADAADLRARLQQRLPAWMVPSAFVALDALPLTTSGKVDRRSLRAPAPAESAAGRAPRSGVEELVAQAYADALGVAAVDADADFFGLGGHSLLAVRLLTRVQSTLGVRLPLRTVFDAPRVTDFAARVETALTGRPPHVDAIPARVADRRAAPASFAQQRIWLQQAIAPASPIYNYPFALRLCGPLSLTAVEQAIAAVVHRHDALRTRISVGADGIAQRIDRVGAVRVPLIDLRSLAPETSERIGARLAAAAGRRPFRADSETLARWHALRLADERHLVVVTLHHATFDGWSTAVLLRELSALYESAVRGLASPLPAPLLQYGDFAQWQQDTWRRDPTPADLAYWVDTLRGRNTDVGLPLDAPRPSLPSGNGGVHPFTIPPGVTARLQRLARREGVTTFMLTLAAFEAALARWSGDAQFAVGVPTAHRDGPESQGAIGLFADLLVLAAEVRPDESFGGLLRRVRRSTIEAFARQDVPFDRVLDALRPARVPGKPPVCQVVYAYQNGPEAEARFPGTRADLLDLAPGASRFDLECHIGQVGDELLGRMLFNRDILNVTTAASFVAAFSNVLAAVADDADCLVGRLPLLGSATRHQEVIEWNASAVRPCVAAHERIQRQMQSRPDATAVVSGDCHVTFGALARRAHAVSRRLRAAGIRPGDRIGVCLPRRPDLVAALLGIAATGGAYVPLDSAYPLDRLRFMAEDARLAALVTTRDADRQLANVAGAVARLYIEDLPDLAREVAPPLQWPPVNQRQLSHFIYTSGSTGTPKAVAITHAGVSRLLDWAESGVIRGSNDVVAAVTSISFDLSVFELLAPLAAGACVVLAEDALRLPGLPWAPAVTLVNTVPSVMAELLRASTLPASVATVILAGEALSGSLAARVYANPGVRRLYNLYGPSEDTTYSTCAVVAPGDAAPAIGRPLPSTQAYLLDSGGEAVPPRVPGELCLGGAGNAWGYWNRPDLTAAAFVPDALTGRSGLRLYRTGDYCRYRHDGTIEYLGRRDHQCKIRGFRIELGEIEATLERHDSVQRAVVVVHEYPASGPRLDAYLEMRPAATVEDRELRTFLRTQLPDYMVPTALVRVDELPRTPHGKVDRRALRPPEQRTPAVATVASETEAIVAAALAEALGVAEVDLDTNFFELGAHSLLLLRVHARLSQVWPGRFELLDLFRRPTVRELASAVAPPQTAASRDPTADGRLSRERDDIAIVGMAGCFPGAPDVETFWVNLCRGTDSIERFSNDLLRAADVSPALLADPAFVPVRGILGDATEFDAGFFGFTPREAQLTDPQQRRFLETAWHALEDAGYAGAHRPRATGVFAGQSFGTYLFSLIEHLGPAACTSDLSVLLGNDKDHLATRVAYRLDLGGPSMTVQTACSTSLVAVHLACHSLLAHECDLALAGGVSIGFPERTGYLYQPGGPLSRDGRCRPFDAQAGGTVVGHGCGIVVLKRLSEARAANDAIWAVIKGSAVNNDGAAKVGYTAPSIDGQAAVIRQALAAARVGAETIGYVEAHGTATALGDPIEVKALSEVYAGGGAARGSCAIGSVKSNIGHLDAAAGVAGLIKAALMLKHGTLVPSLHFSEPNPAAGLTDSPFRVSTTTSPWPTVRGPRRAAVSSFGMGGTNAHLVLEESLDGSAAPQPDVVAIRSHHVVPVSARSSASLDRATAQLGASARQSPAIDLGDAAYTLQVGRRGFQWRRALVGESWSDVARAWADERQVPAIPVARPPRVVFLLPGQGSQVVGMAADLWASEPVFRRELDECAASLRPLIGADIRDLMHPSDAVRGSATARLARTRFAQPAIFAIELALARLWQDWNVTPWALLGHSLGELTAACLAGVMSRPDALALIALRGELMDGLEPGAMMAVRLPATQFGDVLPSELAIAAINLPDQTVVSGPVAAIERLRASLEQQSVPCQRLHTSHAFHSPMVDSILDAFTAAVARTPLRAPVIPMLSNVTGDWLSGADACRPDYWARQLRAPVDFVSCLEKLWAEPDLVLLEVGPGAGLASIARGYGGGRPGPTVVASLPPARSRKSDAAAVAEALARLWTLGAPVDWTSYNRHSRRRIVRLPLYPFDRTRFEPPRVARPTEPAPEGPQAIGGASAGQCYTQSWRRSAPLLRPAAPAGTWLIFAETEVGLAFARVVRRSNRRAVLVTRGSAFGSPAPDSYTVGADQDDYRRLVETLQRDGIGVDTVLLTWSFGESAADFAEWQRRGYRSVAALVQAHAQCSTFRPSRLLILTSRTQDVGGDEPVAIDKTPLVGLSRAIPFECPALDCRIVDAPSVMPLEQLGERLLAEAQMPEGEPVVAFRGRHRWVEAFEPVSLPDVGSIPRLLRPGGFYLVTGGLGPVGLAVATYLADRVQARLVLTGRSGRTASRLDSDRPSSLDRAVGRIRAAGGEVTIEAADVCDARRMREVVRAGEQRFGPLRGIVHAACDPDFRFFRPIDEPQDLDRFFAAKVHGTRVLAAIAEETRPDFCLLMSSLATALGGYGVGPYSAANQFLNAFAAAAAPGPVRWLAVGWDGWLPADVERSSSDQRATTTAEACAVLDRLLDGAPPVTFVSTTPLNAAAARGPAASRARARDTRVAQPPADAPVEQRVRRMFEEVLGTTAVAVNASLFDLGGTSLEAVQLAARVRHVFGVEAPLSELLSDATVGGLARFIDAHRATTSSPAAASVTSASAISATPSEGAAVTIRTLACPTGNRLAALERGLASYLTNCRDFGREIDVVVADDALEAASRRRCRELLRDLGRRFGRRVAYAGLEEKTIFVKRLAARGFDPALLRSALFDAHGVGTTSSGANRNALLLATAGEPVLMVDDDTECRPTPAPQLGPGFRAVSGGGLPEEVWVFGSRGAALDACPPSRVDLVDEHQRYLGRPVRELTGPSPSDELTPADRAAIAGDACVRMTLNGLLGDCGWGSPANYLFLNGPSLDWLCGSQAVYDAALTSREMLRVALQPSAIRTSTIMATFFGLDNRVLMPPFLPAGRGQDALFGANVGHVRQDAWTVHLPIALLHAPATRKSFTEGTATATATGVATYFVVLALMDVAAQGCPAADPADRLRHCGAYLEQVAKSDAADLDEVLRAGLRTRLSAVVEYLDALLARRDGPDYWAERLLTHRRRTVASLDDEHFCVPLDLRAGRSVEQARTVLQTLIGGFGTLLRAWPDLVAAASELRRADHAVARPL